MNKIFSIVILIVGVVLIVLGATAFESFSSDISRIFTGSATYKSFWFLIIGFILGITGFIGILISRKSNSRRSDSTII